MATVTLTRITNYPSVKQGGDTAQQTALVLQNAMLGHLNATGGFTPTNSAASTTISDPRISSSSMLIFWPTNAAAAAATSPYVAAGGASKGTAVVTHANSASTKTYIVAIIG